MGPNQTSAVGPNQVVIPRTGPGKGDPFGADPMGGAPQPPEEGVNLKSPHPKIEVPPPRMHRSGVVTVAGRVVARRTQEVPAPQRHGGHHGVGFELDSGDIDLIKVQQTVKCSSDAHRRWPFFRGCGTTGM